MVKIMDFSEEEKRFSSEENLVPVKFVHLKSSR